MKSLLLTPDNCARISLVTGFDVNPVIFGEAPPPEY